MQEQPQQRRLSTPREQRGRRLGGREGEREEGERVGEGGGEEREGRDVGKCVRGRDCIEGEITKEGRKERRER